MDKQLEISIMPSIADNQLPKLSEQGIGRESAPLSNAIPLEEGATQFRGKRVIQL